MSNKRTRREYEHRTALKNAGWEVHKRDSVAFNQTSETARHFATKALVAYVLKQRGFRVDSEVEGPTGIVDIAYWGQEDPPAAVEVETGMDEETIRDKVSRYHDGQPFREVFVIDPAQLPIETDTAIAWIETEL